MRKESKSLAGKLRRARSVQSQSKVTWQVSTRKCAGGLGTSLFMVSRCQAGRQAQRWITHAMVVSDEMVAGADVLVMVLVLTQ